MRRRGAATTSSSIDERPTSRRTTTFRRIPSRAMSTRRWRKAAFTVDATYTTPSQNSAAMEPHAAIAIWDEDGALTLYGAYQMPTSDAQQLAEGARHRRIQMRIISAYVGGGFGAQARHRAGKRRGGNRGEEDRPPGQGGDASPAGVRGDGAPLEHRAAHPARRRCRGQTDRDRARDAALQPRRPGLFRARRHRDALPVRRREPADHARPRPSQLAPLRLDARAGRGGRHARAGRRDGRARREGRDRPDRAPPPQRSRQRSGEGHSLFLAGADRLPGRRRQALRLGQRATSAARTNG